MCGLAQEDEVTGFDNKGDALAERLQWGFKCAARMNGNVCLRHLNPAQLGASLNVKQL